LMRIVGRRPPTEVPGMASAISNTSQSEVLQHEGHVGC
jgi:hypothetical protein